MAANPTAIPDIIDFQGDEITAGYFAVDREIEQGQIPLVPLGPQPTSDLPHILAAQCPLLPDFAPFVPR